MSLSFKGFSVFRPADETLSSGRKLQVQVHRLLSLLGCVLISMFGVFHAPSVRAAADPVWVYLGIAGLFGALFLASYVSSVVVRTYGIWMRGVLYITLFWVVVLVSENKFDGDYALGLLFAYAVFIAIVGLGLRTVRPVLRFSGIGLLLAGGGILFSAEPETSPALLLGSMFTVAVIESSIIYGHLSTQEKLRDREARLQWAQRLAHLGYWRHNLRDGTLKWSPETYRIFGWSPDVDVTVDSFMDAVHPDDRERLERAQRSILTGGEDLDIEYRIKRPSGEERVLHERGELRRDDTGTPVSVMGAVLDITERKRMERALRQSEERFRGLFEEAALGIGLVDERGVILEANAALKSMLGASPGALHGQHFEEFTHPDDLPTERELYDELVHRERDEYQLEKRYIRQDGSVFWGRVTVSRREVPEGPQLVGMVENIDAEKTRKRRLRLLQKAVEQANESVLITDAHFADNGGPEILYVNPAFTEMTGYEREEVMGRTPSLLQGDETEAWVLERLRRRVEQGKEFEGEAVNYRKDGTPFINHWSLAPVRSGEGGVTHWVAVQRDVTEERRMEKRLLEVQDEERRRIDKEIHDEMGGLLTTLQLTVERTRMEVASEGTSTDAFDDIVALLDELSSVTRTISRRLYPGDLDDHGLDKALSSLMRKMDERYALDVTFESQLDSEERFSSLVELTAYRVIHEALVNVVRHAKTDRAQVRITREGHQLYLHVVDDGKGFDPATQAGDSYGLTGMTERVERLNGTMKIRSAPGEGTQISALLPLTVSEELE